ncbi:MAG: hypothetical protein ACJ8F3_21145 [Xanthobacteraceae bacterium]
MPLLGGGGGQDWFWDLAYNHHKGRTPTRGYEASQEAAITAFRKSWDQA